MQDMRQKMMPGQRKERRVTVPEALRLFQQEEADKLVDEEAINRTGIENAEQNGIIFIDEIDKVIGTDRSEGPDVSREGVQRDLLSIVEGSQVATKFGVITCLIMGWAVLYAGWDLMASLSPGVIVLMVTGGLLYSVGTIFLLAGQIRFHNTIWHLFVVIASVIFFIAIMMHLVQTAP